MSDSSQSIRNLSDLKKKIRYSKYFNYFDPFVKLPEKKFFIYTRGRSGSTVLTDLLNSHPQMYCDYEIFDINNTGTMVKYPKMFVESSSKRASMNSKPVYGFKVKIEQLRDEHKFENYTELIKSLNGDGWKIIYLYRTNIFKHTLSGIISNQTKVFHVRNKENFEHEKIKIDCDFLLGVMNYFENLGVLEEKSLESVPFLRINYEEELLENSSHQKTSDKIFDFLGIKSHPVSTKLKKIIPVDLKKIILNYDEVYEFIGKTKFSVYLD